MPFVRLPLAGAALMLLLCGCSTVPPTPLAPCPQPAANLYQPMPDLPRIPMSGYGPEVAAMPTTPAGAGLMPSGSFTPQVTNPQEIPREH